MEGDLKPFTIYKVGLNLIDIFPSEVALLFTSYIVTSGQPASQQASVGKLDLNEDTLVTMLII